jgi:hypothetical protein
MYEHDAISRWIHAAECTLEAAFDVVGLRGGHEAVSVKTAISDMSSKGMRHVSIRRIQFNPAITLRGRCILRLTTVGWTGRLALIVEKDGQRLLHCFRVRKEADQLHLFQTTFGRPQPANLKKVPGLEPLHIISPCAA